jgi:hypothetical protein
VLVIEGGLVLQLGKGRPLTEEGYSYRNPSDGWPWHHYNIHAAIMHCYLTIDRYLVHR